MVDVHTEILIQASIEQVADFASNPDNAPKWYQNIHSIVWKSPKPLTIGSQLAFIAHFLGKQLAYTYEIIEFIPRKKLVMRTSEGPFPMETSYTWLEIDANTTLMSLRNRGNPKGFSKIYAPFIAIFMRKANKKDLIKIKQLLEIKA